MSCLVFLNQRIKRLEKELKRSKANRRFLKKLKKRKTAGVKK